MRSSAHAAARRPELSPGSSESSRPRHVLGAIPLRSGRSARHTTGRRRDRAHDGVRGTSSARGASVAGFGSSTRRSRARSVRTERGTRGHEARAPTQTSSTRASGGRFPKLSSNGTHVPGTGPRQGAQDRGRRFAGRDSTAWAAGLSAPAHPVRVEAFEGPSRWSVLPRLATKQRGTSPRRRTYRLPVRRRRRFDGVALGIRTSASGSVPLRAVSRVHPDQTPQS
jgi:hypothetical protein